MQKLTKRLQVFPLFRDIPLSYLEEISAVAKIHQLDRGENLPIDTTVGALYVVLSGNVNVVRQQKETETFLFSLKSGEFFGEPPMPLAPGDQKMILLATSAVDIGEIRWSSLMNFLQDKSKVSVLFLERVLVAAAEKFVHISREYSHMVKQKEIPDSAFEQLFGEDAKDKTQP